MNNWSVAADWPGNFWWHALLLMLILIVFLMGTVIIFIWMERRVIARFQARQGPNRAGPFGLMQPVADMIKILTKEDIVPTLSDRFIFWLAPAIAFVPVLMITAVIPLMNGLQLADLNAGVLYITAASSITTLGIFMAGIASNNKYSLIGVMRKMAQLISYAIPLVLALVGLVIVCGSMSVVDIVNAQTIPFALTQPLAFVIFVVATLAEINRTPFDLVECDSELTAGFNTEYSGMKFAMLYLVEYSEVVVASALIATFFLGGWHGPVLPGIAWFIIKVFASFAFILWIRSTFPRLRIDQSMQLAWKGLLPLALVNLLIIALKTVFFPDLPAWVNVPIAMVIAVILILYWAGFLRSRKAVTDG